MSSSTFWEWFMLLLLLTWIIVKQIWQKAWLHTSRVFTMHSPPTRPQELDHIIPILSSRHRLPVCFRISVKALIDLAMSYLAELVLKSSNKAIVCFCFVYSIFPFKYVFLSLTLIKYSPLPVPATVWGLENLFVPRPTACQTLSCPLFGELVCLSLPDI